MIQSLCIGIFLAIIMLSTSGCSPSKRTFSGTSFSKKEVEQIFTEAADQYKVLMTILPRDSFPRNYNPHTGRSTFSNSGWWCSGFYPGTLLYLYEESKDKVLQLEAERMLVMLEKEKLNKGTHDLGFMMFCSFGNARRVAPKPQYSEILITSAKSLSSRFNPNVGCIRSWNSNNPSEFLVIIDNMMNLQLLFWATRETGDSSFHKIAITHANTTAKNHFRPDFSSYHVINYNPQSGAIQQKRTHQGYSDQSAWARGQVWGLYGYTETYRNTKEKVYLDLATHIADFILQHSRLPADKIPYWDFDAPGIPNELRDASAGAILASALLELSDYVSADKSKKYFAAAGTILKTLSSRAYRADAGGNGGYILRHSVGHLPAKSEVDVALTYADYYYVEALIRYKKRF